MRKIAGILCILVMLMIPAGCQSKDQRRETGSTTASMEQQEIRNGRILIAYFSLAENRNTPDGMDGTTSASILDENGRQYRTTEYMARMIQNEIGGDLYSIETKEAYPSDYDAVPKAENLKGLAVEAEEVPDAQETVTQWIQNLGFETERADNGNEQIYIAVTAGEHVLSGILYGTDLADEIQEQFPLTMSMVNYGGREFYGGIDFTPKNSGNGQMNFENGDITYCSQNNTLAVFYAQTENPDLTMEVQPIGKIVSDLSVLEELPETVEMTFQIAK